MSVSNGDSTSGLISPYGNAQSQLQQHYNINPAQQQPHMSNYRSISQHTMAPPTTQAEPDIAGFEPWMGTLERYHMGLMDDLGQHNSSDIFSIDPAANSMNYMQALSAQPQIGAGAAW
jgi:hypothetical protein